jgi:hypothetical protein
MGIIERFDTWTIEHLESFLDWLNEWLSISQKTVERVLTLIYFIREGLFFAKHHNVTLLIMGMFIVLIMVGRTILMDKRTRLKLRYSEWKWRFLILSMNLLSVAIPPYGFNLITEIMGLSFAVFNYVFVCSVDGEKGRRRKMALSKLKELFSWLPDPIPEGV